MFVIELNMGDRVKLKTLAEMNEEYRNVGTIKEPIFCGFIFYGDMVQRLGSFMSVRRVYDVAFDAQESEYRFPLEAIDYVIRDEMTKSEWEDIDFPDRDEALIPLDPVNHPTHYTQHPSGVECIQVTEHMNFNLGNVIKYVMRAGLKDPKKYIEDLQKAEFYLNREIERYEKENTLFQWSKKI